MQRLALPEPLVAGDLLVEIAPRWQRYLGPQTPRYLRDSLLDQLVVHLGPLPVTAGGFATASGDLIRFSVELAGACAEAHGPEPAAGRLAALLAGLMRGLSWGSPLRIQIEIDGAFRAWPRHRPLLPWLTDQGASSLILVDRPCPRPERLALAAWPIGQFLTSRCLGWLGRSGAAALSDAITTGRGPLGALVEACEAEHIARSQSATRQTIAAATAPRAPCADLADMARQALRAIVASSPQQPLLAPILVGASHSLLWRETTGAGRDAGTAIAAYWQEAGRSQTLTPSLRQGLAQADPADFLTAIAERQAGDLDLWRAGTAEDPVFETVDIATQHERRQGEALIIVNRHLLAGLQLPSSAGIVCHQAGTWDPTAIGFASATPARHDDTHAAPAAAADGGRLISIDSCLRLLEEQTRALLSSAAVQPPRDDSPLERLQALTTTWTRQGPRPAAEQDLRQALQAALAAARQASVSDWSEEDEPPLAWRDAGGTVALRWPAAVARLAPEREWPHLAQIERWVDTWSGGQIRIRHIAATPHVILPPAWPAQRLPAPTLSCGRWEQGDLLSPQPTLPHADE